MATEINRGRAYGSGRNLAKLMGVDETTVYRWYSEDIILTFENEKKLEKLHKEARKKWYKRGSRLKGDQA